MAYWMNVVGFVAIGLWLSTVVHVLMMFVRYVGAWRNGRLSFTLLGAWSPDMPPEVKFHRKWAVLSALGFAALILATIKLSH